MQDFDAFIHNILHIITSKTIDLPLKGLTGSTRKFQKSLKAFIYKGFSDFENLSYHLVTSFCNKIFFYGLHINLKSYPTDFSIKSYLKFISK